MSTNGEIPEVRIHSRLGGVCTVVNPWPGNVVRCSKPGMRPLAPNHHFVIPTKPGDEFTLTPAGGVLKSEPISVARNAEPKWPFHQGPDGTLEAYLMRTTSFGMLGIAKDGQNPTRNKVQMALKEQKASERQEINPFHFKRPISRVELLCSGARALNMGSLRSSCAG